MYNFIFFECLRGQDQANESESSAIAGIVPGRFRSGRLIRTWSAREQRQRDKNRQKKGTDV
jgi:hypothetical protein